MADNRYDELTPQERVDIDQLINTLAAHKGIDSPAMRSARTTGVRRAIKGIQTAYEQEVDSQRQAANARDDALDPTNNDNRRLPRRQLSEFFF